MITGRKGSSITPTFARYHVLANRRIDIESIRHGVGESQNPRNLVAELAESLDAQIHDGRDIELTFLDRIVAWVTRTQPLWWAIARDARQRVQHGDVIYCTGEDIGFPVAALCGRLAKVSLMVHRADSRKKLLAFRLLGLSRKTAFFFAVSKRQVAILENDYRIPSERVAFVWDQTDTEFFSPGEPREKGRPIVASVGLERRDYETLIAATRTLDVDVRISAFSADTRSAHRELLGSAMPPNMTKAFYPWPNLVQLYRDADVVVVPLLPSTYAAGVQGLMEALSCGKPVVVSDSPGLNEYISGQDAVRVVEPEDPERLRQAISEVIGDRATAYRQSLAARSLAERRHRLEDHVAVLGDMIRALSTSQ